MFIDKVLSDCSRACSCKWTSNWTDKFAFHPYEPVRTYVRNRILLQTFWQFLVVRLQMLDHFLTVLNASKTFSAIQTFPIKLQPESLLKRGGVHLF